jgi:hypothetical protein
VFERVEWAQTVYDIANATTAEPSAWLSVRGILAMSGTKAIICGSNR